MQPSIDLSHETAMGWAEWGLVLLVLIVAGIYLWRKIFVKKGCGCSGCGKEKTCAVKPQAGQEKPVTFHK